VIISRGYAWDAVPNVKKTARTHGNCVRIVKMSKNTRERSNGAVNIRTSLFYYFTESLMCWTVCHLLLILVLYTVTVFRRAILRYVCLMAWADVSQSVVCLSSVYVTHCPEGCTFWQYFAAPTSSGTVVLMFFLNSRRWSCNLRVKGMKQEVKVIWQKAPHGGPIPRLGVTPGGRKLYHWIPGVVFPISVP